MNTRSRTAARTKAECEDAPSLTVHQAKQRRCLTCGSVFASAWSGERICPRCKTKSGWRGGFQMSAARTR